MGSPNSSSEYTDYFLIIKEPAFWLCLGVVGLIQSTAIITANFVLLLTTYKDPQKTLRTPPCLLIANLGAADLSLGLTVVFPVALRDIYRYLLLPDKFPRAFGPIAYIILGITLFVSSGTIIALSASCYVAINSPIQYQTKITKIRVVILIAALWIFSILICILGVVFLSEASFILAFLHTHVSFPAILLTAVHISVFRALARKTRELQLNETDSVVISRHALEREKTMVVAIVIVLAMFYVTYLPQFITLHLFYLCSLCREPVVFYKIDAVSSRFLFLNSAINPFIYAWRVPKYRRAFIDCWSILKSRIASRSDQPNPSTHRQRRSRQIMPYASHELTENQRVQLT